MNFRCRHRIDDFTSVEVYRNDKAEHNERYACLFSGKYYTYYDGETGERRSLCILCDPAGETYRWKDEKRGRHLGVKMHWFQIPEGVKELVYYEYRRNIPCYGKG